MIQFLQDKNGHLSSKRLGFITSLVTAILGTIGTLIFLLSKEKYELAVNLLDSVWLACFGFAGIVASEFFGKKKEKENEVS